jgi:Domain of unknown function (DU1801)
MKPFTSPLVAQTFEAYPASMRRKMLALRDIIFSTAAETDGVGELEETLKWGEPAYLTSSTGSGSTIRIAWKKTRPREYAMVFNCRTTLVETFRTLFPGDFTFEGNRALVFSEAAAVPRDALVFCIATALTYHRAARPRHQRGGSKNAP